MVTGAIGTGQPRAVASLGVADLVCFAAAPAFAAMALLTAVPGEAHEMLCGGMHGASSLNGMTGMYLLMSVFHSAPWLRLIPRRR